MTSNKTSFHLQALVEAFADPIFVMSEQGDYLDVLGGKDSRYYADGEALIGKNYKEALKSDFLIEQFLRTIKKSLEHGGLETIEYQINNDDLNFVKITEETKIHSSGKQWYEARIYPLNEDVYGQKAVIWLAFNITDKKNQEDMIASLSTTDKLTGTYTKNYFLEILAEDLKISKLNKSNLFLFTIDITNYREIFHRLGYSALDKLMIFIVNVLHHTFKDFGRIARLETNLFIVSVEGSKLIDMRSLEKKILDDLDHKTIENLAINLKSSVCEYNSNHKNIHDFLGEALRSLSSK